MASTVRVLEISLMDVAMKQASTAMHLVFPRGSLVWAISTKQNHTLRRATQESAMQYQPATSGTTNSRDQLPVLGERMHQTRKISKTMHLIALMPSMRIKGLAVGFFLLL